MPQSRHPVRASSAPPAVGALWLQRCGIEQCDTLQHLPLASAHHRLASQVGPNTPSCGPRLLGGVCRRRVFVSGARARVRSREIGSVLLAASSGSSKQGEIEAVPQRAPPFLCPLLAGATCLCLSAIIKGTDWGQEAFCLAPHHHHVRLHRQRCEGVSECGVRGATRCAAQCKQSLPFASSGALELHASTTAPAAALEQCVWRSSPAAILLPCCSLPGRHRHSGVVHQG